MNKRLTKLLTKALVIGALLSPLSVGQTGSYFMDEARIVNNSVEMGCWVSPSVPVLLAPADGAFIGYDDPWVEEPLMDWEDTTSLCPSTIPIEYHFEAFKNPALENPTRTMTVEDSEYLYEDIQDGEYWWRVKACHGEEYCSEWSDVFSFVLEKDIKPGVVVINEIMWMGSEAHELDEWIELRNMTRRPVNLEGWKLYGAGPDGHAIELEGVIEPEGYYLLSHYPVDHTKSAIRDELVNDDVYIQVDKLVHLNDNGEKLKLRSQYGTLIDETPDIPQNNKDKDKGWVEGQQGSYGNNGMGWHSMQRIEEPGDGEDPENWTTCWHATCNDTEYWDEEGESYGTPGKANIIGGTKPNYEKEKGNAKKDEGSSQSKNEENGPVENSRGPEETAEPQLIPEEEQNNETGIIEGDGEVGGLSETPLPYSPTDTDSGGQNEFHENEGTAEEGGTLLNYLIGPTPLSVVLWRLFFV